MSTSSSNLNMLRGPRSRWARQLDDSAPVVMDVDPEDGASGVLRDATLVVRLSRPADPATVADGCVRVIGREGAVPSRLVLSPDRTMIVWVGRGLLAPHVEHTVHVQGIRDLWGAPLAPYVGRFVSGDLSSLDWREPD